MHARTIFNVLAASTSALACVMHASSTPRLSRRRDWDAVDDADAQDSSKLTSVSESGAKQFSCASLFTLDWGCEGPSSGDFALGGLLGGTTVKCKLGGVVGDLPDSFTIHAVILRRFAFDNPQLLWTDEVVPEEDDSGESSPPPKKKRKINAKQGGRVAAGQDFWGKVDIHLKEEITRPDLRYKYIDQLIADDETEYASMTPGVAVSALMANGDPAASTSATSQFGTDFTAGFSFNTSGAGAVSWGTNLFQNGMVSV
ncbi:hypothetical protein B0H19DRAFT_1271259 [Mycena capillaripes]|nr:hypothetical protein B0H19DRAFT_1271259 [Mycena capillaripes]